MSDPISMFSVVADAHTPYTIKMHWHTSSTIRLGGTVVNLTPTTDPAYIIYPEYSEEAIYVAADDLSSASPL